MPITTTSASSGQRQMSSTVTPNNTTAVGIMPKIRVSARTSSAHMPREIFRTVAPAKELPCQFDEKRCTRAKESFASASIATVVTLMIAKVTNVRSR